MGFVGTLLILQPGAEGFMIFAALPFVAAALYALAAVLTNTKCVAASPANLSLNLNLGFLLVGGASATINALVPPTASSISSANVFLARSWQPIATDEWTLLAILGTISAIAELGTAIAYQRGRLPIIATLDYSYLAFAAIWGLVIVADGANPTAIVGMLVITAAGVLAVRTPTTTKRPRTGITVRGP